MIAPSFTAHLDDDERPVVAMAHVRNDTWMLHLGSVSIFGTHDQLARLVDDIATVGHAAPEVAS